MNSLEKLLMHYILDENNNPVAVSLMEWAQFFEESLDRRRVAQTSIPDLNTVISTVFLGIDHSFSREGPPILFESMTFEGSLAGTACDRYATWEEALKGHEKMVADFIARKGGEVELIRDK